MNFFFINFAVNAGFSVSHVFEEHTHSTHGHQSAISLGHGEDGGDTHSHSKAGNEGTSFFYGIIVRRL